MSRFSLVWISAAEQLFLEETITQILKQLSFVISCFIDDNLRNETSEKSKIYAGSFNVRFTESTGKAQSWMFFKYEIQQGGETCFKEVFLAEMKNGSNFSVPDGVSLATTVKYIMERLRQFMIFSISLPGYKFKIAFLNPAYDEIQIKWEKED